jgi:hypothetical protein
VQREILCGSGREGDRAVPRRVLLRGLHQAENRVDAGDLEAEPGGQADGVLALTTPGVHGHRAGRKSQLRHVAEQRVRTRRVERPVQFLVELLLDHVVRIVALHPGFSVAHTSIFQRGRSLCEPICGP